MDGRPERAAKKAKHGGRRCVAGGSSSISCSNSQYTDGVSVRLFPNKEKDTKRYNAWVRFVRTHRPDFECTSTSYLCSVHFESCCFTTNKEMAVALGMKLKLQKDAVPTIDTAGKQPADGKDLQNSNIGRLSKAVSQIIFQVKPRLF